ALGGYPRARPAALPAAVSDGRQVSTLVSDVRDRFGRLDVVVSNAAGYETGPITELSDEAWEQLRATNVDAFFHLAKAALPHLVTSGGNLVAVSSVSGQRGDWGQAAYNATKAAIDNFVRSLALDWGAQGGRRGGVWRGGGGPCARGTVTRGPVGRPVDPPDIPPVVLFLASDAARYVTGVI